jgi:hypothetical protein
LEERRATEAAAFRAGIAALQAKLNLLPKTPHNSSVPPSLGRKKTTEFGKSRSKQRVIRARTGRCTRTRRIGG